MRGSIAQRSGKHHGGDVTLCAMHGSMVNRELLEVCKILVIDKVHALSQDLIILQAFARKLVQESASSASFSPQPRSNLRITRKWLSEIGPGSSQQGHGLHFGGFTADVVLLVMQPKSQTARLLNFLRLRHRTSTRTSSSPAGASGLRA